MSPTASITWPWYSLIRGKFEAAESLNRKSLAMMQKLQGAEHPDVANSLDFLASSLDGQEVRGGRRHCFGRRWR